MIEQPSKITETDIAQDENFEGLPPRICEFLTNASEALPILRQSRVDIPDRTTGENSTASDIGKVIMRDQVLMTRILKVVNSPAYHTRSPVSHLPQAVTLLGFDVIRNVTIVAQLIEQAEAMGGQSPDIRRLLARALLSATGALEFGAAIEYPNSGYLFTSAMLYTLGDLVLAHYLPDIYQQLEVCRKTAPDHLPALEVELLGLPLYRFAVLVSRQWNLPDCIVKIIQSNPTLSGKRLNTHREQFDGLVCSTNDLVRLLLDPHTPATEATLGRLTKKMATAFDISPATVKAITERTFEKASLFSEAVNLDIAYFLPDIGWKNSQVDPLFTQSRENDLVNGGVTVNRRFDFYAFSVH